LIPPWIGSVKSPPQAKNRSLRPIVGVDLESSKS
jgi:hypothetical protein